MRWSPTASKFREIVADAERISAEHFGGCFRRPEGGYAGGPAFRGDVEVMAALESQYDEIMDVFYFGERPYPPFADVLDRVTQHAGTL